MFIEKVQTVFEQMNHMKNPERGHLELTRNRKFLINKIKTLRLLIQSHFYKRFIYHLNNSSP